MSIPLSLFLYIYLFGIFVFLVGSFFNLYHILRFGIADRTSKLASFTYIIISLIILGISFYYILKIDWNQSFNLFIETL